MGEFESGLPGAVLRDATAGMAFLDTDLRFAWVNPALARMYGRQADDFARQPIAAVWPAVDAARAEAALRQVLDQGHPAIETFEAGAASVGSAAPGPDSPLPGQRTFHWFPVRDADGALCGAGLIVIAGAAAPATEEALRRSEERYRALVEGGAQIVWVASPDGAMMEDAPQWRGVTGQGVEEFLGDGWLDAIHPEDRQRTEVTGARRCAAGRMFDDRFRMRVRGRLLPPLRGAGGPDHPARPDRRVGRRQHRRHQPARGRGDARPADRPARRRGAAHRPAPAGDRDAGRGARPSSRSSRSSSTWAGPRWRAALGGGPARQTTARPAGGQRGGWPRPGRTAPAIRLTLDTPA